MRKALRIFVVLGTVAGIAAVSVMPYTLKSRFWFSRHSFELDLVPYPPLYALFGPLLTVNPHTSTHFMVYAIAAWILFRLTAALWRFGAVTGLAVLAYGTETAQVRMYKNPFEWADIRSDLAGIAAGLLVCYSANRISSLLARKRQAPEPGSTT